MNVSYKTAFRWWKAGRLDAFQLDTGTIIVRDPLPETPTPNGIALYARVSTQGQKADLEQEAQRNGYELDWTFDQEKMEFEYTSKKRHTKSMKHM